MSFTRYKRESSQKNSFVKSRRLGVSVAPRVETPSATSPNPWGQNIRTNFVSLGGLQTTPT